MTSGYLIKYFRITLQQATLQKDKPLAQFIADPSIKKSVKAEGLAAACDKLKLSPLTKNLFVAMAENGRYANVMHIDIKSCI